jgi:hypothetical protein
MSTNNSCENVQKHTNTCNSRSNNGFIILIVLYILLAIILGSRLY